MTSKSRSSIRALAIIVVIACGILLVVGKRPAKPLYGASARTQLALAVSLASLGKPVTFTQTPNFAPANQPASSMISDAQVNTNSGMAKGWGLIWAAPSAFSPNVAVFDPHSDKPVPSFGLQVKKTNANNTYLVKSMVSYGPDEFTGKKISQISAFSKVSFVNDTIIFYADNVHPITLANGKRTDRLVYRLTNKKLLKYPLVKEISKRIYIK